MPTTDRICPSCRRWFEHDAAFCPFDRHPLLHTELGADPRIREEIDGRFTLLGVLGRGGMGVVYRALQHSMCREVAIKLLDPSQQTSDEAVRRFLREAREASRLSHPNVITLFDFGQTERGELYLVMELLRGRSLADILDESAPLAIERAVGIASQICDALAAAHARLIVHRDLKPENVIVLNEGGRTGEFIKVIDFGIAKVRALDGSPSVTRAEEVTGTPLYMPPEQILGERLDGRADLYALGGLLFHMLTGRLPFERRGVAELLVAHMQADPPSARDDRPEIPAALDRLITSALAKDPERRPRTAEDFGAELREALASAGASRRASRLSSIPTSTIPRDGAPTNLSTPATSFVGRASDVARLRLLLSGGARLVTIHGPGGMGKTRLAVEFGRRFLADEASRSGGGIWFCDVTEAATLEGVCVDVARVLHTPLLSGDADDPVQQVANAISARGRILLIIDNFEQVSQYAEQTIGRWLRLAPEARFLVTSRVRLGLPDEEVLTLDPLSLPEDDPEGDSEAVDLFVERARAARPGFSLEGSEAVAVRDLVRALDGMPLAIELAAARMSIMTPRQILERLEARFQLLRSRVRTRTGRQATLQATIDWSWSLLDPWEQSALAQLSVFAGGFTADVVEGVVELDEFADAPWTLDVVQTLGDKSLVRTTISPEFTGELRLGLYESIRDYAARKLDESGRRGAVEARHTAWFLRTCGAWAEAVGGRDSVHLRKLLSLEMENLENVRARADSRYATASDETERRRAAEDQLRATLAMDPVLRARGPFARHLAWLDEAVDRAAAAGVAPEILVRGHLARGEVRRTKKRSSESGEDFARALELSRELSDRRLEGRALHGLANLSHGQARIEDSIRLFEEALEVHREAGDRSSEGETLGALGNLYIWTGKLDLAQEHLEAALRCLREAGDARFEGFTLVALGALHFERGEAVPARRYVEQSLEVLADAGDLRYQGEAHMTLAFLDWGAGDLTSAREHIVEALAIGRELGDQVFLSRYLAILAAIDARAGRLADAHEAFNAAEPMANGAGSSLVILFVSLLRGQLDLGQAREARSERDEEALTVHVADARARVGPARAPGLDGSPPPCEVCDEVRFALRMLEKALEDFDDVPLG